METQSLQTAQRMKTYEAEIKALHDNILLLQKQADSKAVLAAENL
jgi:hypothetical protein